MGTMNGAAGDRGPQADGLPAQPQGPLAQEQKSLGQSGQMDGLGQDRGLPQGQGQQQHQGDGH